MKFRGVPKKKQLLIVVAVLFAAYTYFQGKYDGIQNGTQPNVSEQAAINSDKLLANAFSNRKNNLQVYGQGIVIKVLRDDNKGSRHQKFIVKLNSGQTLVVAHNIDLAPRVTSIAKGDAIQFYGEYEWNNRGGVIHWTHRDPKGYHPHGWLKHKGQTYQ